MLRACQTLLMFICCCKRSLTIALMLAVAPTAVADNNTDGKWVEEPVIKTEWLEQVVTPVSRWMEQRIQGSQHSAPVVHEAPEVATLPTHVISPTEAARLLTLLFPGEVLRIQLLDTQPTAYSIKLLSEQGSISSFYMDAADGTLLEDRPPLAPAQPQTDKETSDENSDR
ncbi:PepSY domain-containing protein [Bacterioplanoides sp.]|uniref:PepSY domain-containing protein n=1 Tax=Bacterioplanoides sp. TaxID=2066072 RepID=UPI003B58DF2E